jgi:hypothetical protein
VSSSWTFLAMEKFSSSDQICHFSIDRLKLLAGAQHPWGQTEKGVNTTGRTCTRLSQGHVLGFILRPFPSLPSAMSVRAVCVYISWM